MDSTYLLNPCLNISSVLNNLSKVHFFDSNLSEVFAHKRHLAGKFMTKVSRDKPDVDIFLLE